MSETAKRQVTVLGAGYTGLTTAAELALRNFKVHVVASDLGYRPPLTIVGTQSRRWPGSATSNTTFDNDDLLDKEIVTIQRFIALINNPDQDTGVCVVPALKVSRKEGNTWNRRPLDGKRLKAASEVQRCLRLMAKPRKVADEEIEAFKKNGYKSVDETQVLRIETDKYFNYLMNFITESGGTIELGTYLTQDDIKTLKSKGHVVNCLGNNAGKVGGGQGEYFSNPGEVLVWKRCPRDFDFYIMDDDFDAGVMQMPNGSLYLSTAAKAGPEQTMNTLKDCDGVCKTLFNEILTLESKDGWESWKTDRPMRKEGFNIGAEKNANGYIFVQNSGHGGAGVAASWACASKAADALIELY